MSQIDPESTTDIEVPCICLTDAGLAHQSDTVAVRDQYGYGDLIDIQTKSIRYVPIEKNGTTEIASVFDRGLEHFALLSIAVKSWTFVTRDGSPLPVSVESFRRLPEETGNLVALRINEIYEASREQMRLPNPSSGRSQGSSPESSAATSKRKRSTSKR